MCNTNTHRYTFILFLKNNHNWISDACSIFYLDSFCILRQSPLNAGVQQVTCWIMYFKYLKLLGIWLRSAHEYIFWTSFSALAFLQAEHTLNSTMNSVNIRLFQDITKVITLSLQYKLYDIMNKTDKCKIWSIN